MKKTFLCLLAFAMLFSLVIYSSAMAEDAPHSTFEEQGLADRVVTISDGAENLYEYPYSNSVTGKDYLFYVTPRWGYPSWSDPEKKGWEGPDVPTYRPEGAKSESIFDCASMMKEIIGQLDNPDEYEWRSICLKLDFNGEENVYWSTYLDDYYESEAWEASKTFVPWNNGSGYWTYTVNWQGKEQTVYQFGVYAGTSDMDGNPWLKLSMVCCVPKGYDGLVAVMYTEDNLFVENKFPEGTHFYDYINDDTLFFRLTDPEELASKAETGSKQEYIGQIVQTDTSLEDYYPVLSENYGGIPVPVPDGTQRLVKITMDESNMLPVCADFSYDSNGALSGVTTYFDGIAAYEEYKKDSIFEIEELEKDELGRVVKVVRSAGDLKETVIIIYSEDGLSYKRLSNYNDDDPRKTERILSQLLISDAVKKTPEEVSSVWTFEYNDDELPVRAKVEKDGAVINEKNYKYSYLTWDNGSLKTVTRQDTDSSNQSCDIFSFDEHGYLTEYCYYYIGVPITFSYQYETIS